MSGFSKNEALKCLDSAWTYKPNYPCTEFGNVDRLIFLFKDILKYVEGTGWYAFDDKKAKWIFGTPAARRCARVAISNIRAEIENQDDEERRKELTKHLFRSSTDRMLNAMLNIAKDSSEIRVGIEEVDSDPLLLKVQNGIVDLRSGHLIESEPNYFITKEVPITYDNDAKCPRFMRFLDEIFMGDDDLINYVQRAIGYTLTGDNGEQCMFILSGEGENGKSKLQYVISSLLGQYGVAAPPQMLVSRTRSATNDLARLQGARMLSLSEESAGAKWDEALVKQLTGGDQISARALYKEHIDFTVMAKMWMATNHLPLIVGVDHAIWRRLKVIPFKYTVPPELRDNRIEEKLYAELPGILYWAIEGCLEWQREGLGSCEAVEEAVSEYRSRSDLLYTWLNARTVAAVGKKTNATALYRDYISYAVGNDLDMSQKKFSQLLSDREYRKKRRGDGYYYHGIALKSDMSPRRGRRSRRKRKD